jgi:hypothetical protein
MKPFTTALVVAHNRLTTDKPIPSMATSGGMNHNNSDKMESVHRYTMSERNYHGNLEFGNLETTDELITPSPLNSTDYGGATTT